MHEGEDRHAHGCNADGRAHPSKKAEPSVFADARSIAPGQIDTEGLLYMMCKFPSEMAHCTNVFLEFYVFPLVDDDPTQGDFGSGSLNA
jgi:hypothetical protein